MWDILSRPLSETGHLEQTLTTGTDYNLCSFFDSRYSDRFWKKKLLQKLPTTWPIAYNLLVQALATNLFSNIFDFYSEHLSKSASDCLFECLILPKTNKLERLYLVLLSNFIPFAFHK